MKKHVIIALIVIALFSCKTKHKVIQRERTKTETNTAKTVNELQKNNVQTTNETHISSGAVIISNINEIELIQDNSGKPITIIDETGKKISFPGVSKAKIKTHETTETKQDSTRKKMSVKDKSQIAKNTSSQESNKTSTAKRNSDSKAKHPSVLLWVFLILALALYLAYRYFKK